MNSPSSDTISASRRKLQDPYAHLDADGNFDALAATSRPQLHVTHGLSEELVRKYIAQEAATPIKSRYSIVEIEYRARSLQISLWKDRDKIWPVATSSNPINVLDPVVALRLLGYDCELDETLGQYSSDGSQVEIAGTLDKQARKVRLSRRFNTAVRSFTAAHELGHAVLHNIGTSLHRDRPLDGSTHSRASMEFEADKFASFFLMPAKQVQASFERIFLTDQFTLNEATAFALGQGDYQTLSNKCKTLRQLSRLLASAVHYNGQHFMSLANQFLVSDEAMAIRLEELGLVAL
jgi:Zn-dependent peptidase ImmA (M78 family)